MCQRERMRNEATYFKVKAEYFQNMFDMVSLALL
jgi:hypothetical protein